MIFGAQLAPPQKDPDAIALQLVNGIFGGKFSSRINMNLREDKHWSYGVRAVLAGGPRAATLYQRVGGADRQDQGIDASSWSRNTRTSQAEKPITADELKDEQDKRHARAPGHV